MHIHVISRYAGDVENPTGGVRNVVNDGQALRAVLTDPTLCGYPADHIRLLHDAGATRQAILDGLAWLAKCAAADGDVTAVVYFSRHGWLDEAGTGARPLRSLAGGVAECGQPAGRCGGAHLEPDGAPGPRRAGECASVRDRLIADEDLPSARRPAPQWNGCFHRQCNEERVFFACY